MFSPLPTRRSFAGGGALSAGVHLAVIGVFVFFARMHPVHVFTLPGTDLGTRVELTYMPGRAPAPASHPQPKIKPRKVSGPPLLASTTASATNPLPPLPHLTVTEAAPSPSPNVSSPASAIPDSSSGSDSYGSG